MFNALRGGFHDFCNRNVLPVGWHELGGGLGIGGVAVEQFVERFSKLPDSRT